VSKEGCTRAKKEGKSNSSFFSAWENKRMSKNEGCCWGYQKKKRRGAKIYSWFESTPETGGATRRRKHNGGASARKGSRKGGGRARPLKVALEPPVKTAGACQGRKERTRSWQGSRRSQNPYRDKVEAGSKCQKSTKTGQQTSEPVVAKVKSSRRAN